jgi:FKBP-type peptidyl-prolyl cis-trans isomerase SlyD
VSHTVGPGTSVKLHYVVRDDEGEAVADEVVERVFGYGQLLPTVEQAIDGLGAGAKRNARLRPQDAFGERDPKAVIEVQRTEFPDDVAPGDHFEAEDAEGKFVMLTVLDVDAERVVVDQNHPLAGLSLALELHVLDVRVADSAEIDAAEAALGEASPRDISLIPPQALLARGQRRNEDGKSPDGAAHGSRGRRGKPGDQS